MDREKLVEAMALAMANVRRAACKLPPLEYLTTVKLDEREALIAEARAALAVAEPVVRADERSRCERIALRHAIEHLDAADAAGLMRAPKERAQAASRACKTVAASIARAGGTP